MPTQVFYSAPYGDPDIFIDLGIGMAIVGKTIDTSVGNQSEPPILFDGMSYNITIENKDHFLLIRASGKRTLESVVSLTEKVVQACREHGVRAALVDVRKLEGRLDTLSAYEVSSEHFRRIRDRVAIQKAAVVDIKGYEDRYRFFENVAVNRGFNLRVFTEADAAIAWLSEQ